MWQRAENPLDKKVKAALWFDFRSSYLFSQGEPILHRHLLMAMEVGQRLVWPEAMLDRRNAAMKLVQRDFARTGIPAGHSTARKPNLTPEKEYRTRWNIYKNIVASAETSERLTPDYRRILRYVIHDSATSDRWYIKHSDGRSSTFSSDPFVSYTREYIVCGKDTRSQSFNYVFALAHQLLHQELEHPVEFVMRDEVLALASNWEDHHPGQEFWVPAVGDNPFIVPSLPTEGD